MIVLDACLDEQLTPTTTQADVDRFVVVLSKVLSQSSPLVERHLVVNYEEWIRRDYNSNLLNWKVARIARFKFGGGEGEEGVTST